MKFDQILVQPLTNISNFFLAQFWKLETISRLFYDFDEIAIWYDLLIFTGSRLLFLIALVHTFRKMENHLL